MGQWELLIWLYGPMGASHLVKTKRTLTDELPSERTVRSLLSPKRIVGFFAQRGQGNSSVGVRFVLTKLEAPIGPYNQIRSSYWPIWSKRNEH